MKFVTCTLAAHGGAILDILNEQIRTSTAVYEYVERTPDSMVAWFKAKDARNYPVIGVEDESGTLMGFASYGVFRERPAYKYTVEHSVYVHQDHRGKGLGLVLMERLIEAARAQDLHVMVGGIDATNAGSIALHEKLGFVHAGTIRESGYKFGTWLDLAFYQLTLQTPLSPTEG
ncbi:GNAT family N-acetyltransferase [Steroidobacter cummioxidans]|uniref:GNAT family N-acetyltransferase n=1 Tax=Steroidobacter cummioxidans TaxID=1803913 RepID=UPI000E317E22|nr:GNAT family N-acetyltransferase [Steroidobacter cummioxidans]